MVAVIFFHSLRKLSLDFIACKALHGTEVSVGNILLCCIGDGAAWLQAYKKSVRICTDTRGEICNFVARLSAGLFPRRSNPAYSLLVLSPPALMALARGQNSTNRGRFRLMVSRSKSMALHLMKARRGVTPRPRAAHDAKLAPCASRLSGLVAAAPRHL